MENRAGFFTTIKRYISLLVVAVLFMTAILGCNKAKLPADTIITPTPTEQLSSPEPTNSPQPTPEPEDGTEDLFSDLWNEFQKKYLEYGALCDHGLIDGQKVFESGCFPSLIQAEARWNDACLHFHDNLSQLDRESLTTTDSVLRYEYLDHYFSSRDEMGDVGRKAGLYCLPVQVALILWAFPIRTEEELNQFSNAIIDCKRFWEESLQFGAVWNAGEIGSLTTDAPNVILSALESKLSLMGVEEGRSREELVRVSGQLEDCFCALDGFLDASGLPMQDECTTTLPVRLSWMAGTMDDPEDCLALLESSMQELMLIFHSLEEPRAVEPSAAAGKTEGNGIQEAGPMQEETEENDDGIAEENNPIPLGTDVVYETVDLPGLFCSLSPGIIHYITGRFYHRTIDDRKETEAYELLLAWDAGQGKGLFIPFLPRYYEGLGAYLSEWVLINDTQEGLIGRYRIFLDHLVLEKILPSITDILVLNNGMEEMDLEKYLESKGLGRLGLAQSLYEHAQRKPLQEMPSALGYVYLSGIMRELSSLMEERFREEEVLHYLCGLGPLYWDQVTETSFEWAEKTIMEG